MNISDEQKVSVFSLINIQISGLLQVPANLHNAI